ncbi:MAG: 1-deoxy-D-xylulose-5-phosphate reductoisomerase [Coriobacteriia bacterium]|nr:1-deoxy-D-xylulose-5-phosphate reductoisomerase [Coriobacteriia bacterium]
MNIAILGSTGSIGKQALDVVARFPEQLRVVALAANTSVEALASQARDFNVKRLAVGDSSAHEALIACDLPAGAHASYGLGALEELAALDEVDVVLNALVGAKGLRISHTALTHNKRLALANKESLVVGGDLLMPLARCASRPDALIPVDSEHSALFQCLLGENTSEVARLWITASGGPFYGRSRSELETITREQALAHPTWRMGPKITIDSATLMNKGLEVIEAHHLFAMPYEQISVVVHPQSRIHSMIAYRDGSIKAHLGVTDMRIPIQYAFSYPARWQAPVSELSLTEMRDLTFGAPDLETFGCLALALEAGRTGGTAPAALNAANEVAVATFLNGRCGFLDIQRCVEAVLSRCDAASVQSIEHLEEVDGWARSESRAAIEKIKTER